MSVTATFASLPALFAVALGLAFFWVTRLPKCPRCGGADWVPLPHLGPFVRYCRRCSYTEDAATGRRG
jgi:hypothetical protein